MDLRKRVRGCFLAGAVGDALGHPVEFLSWTEICNRFGPGGVTAPARSASFTDDTQMSLFTAEGLIRARVRQRSKGICHPPDIVRHAYLRWLHTQGVPWAEAGGAFADGAPRPDGWLVSQAVLHRQMAPGATCLAALRAGGNGTVDRPANASKGCGAVMRAAPVGLFHRTADETWSAACDIAAITHGHPDGIHSAGVLAVTIRLLANGEPIADAIRGASQYAPTGGGTRTALARATDLAAGGLPGPERLNRVLGEGWTGDEAMAIAACCALAAPTLAAGLLAAVNHSGDSDSTGSITGNLLGAVHGPDAIPEDWLDCLEGRSLVEQVAADFATELLDPPRELTEPPTPVWWQADFVPTRWWNRYPGW